MEVHVHLHKCTACALNLLCRLRAVVLHVLSLHVRANLSACLGSLPFMSLWPAGNLLSAMIVESLSILMLMVI